MGPSWSPSAALLLSMVGLSTASFERDIYKHVANRALKPRAASTLVYNTSALPGQWAYQSCWTDIGRTINLAAYGSNTAMTTEACISFCDSGSYIYAGTEYSQECYCGNILPAASKNASESDCSMSCSGNNNEVCGGPGRLSLYWSGKTPPSPPIINPGPTNWTSLGCWQDNNGGRTLTTGVDLPKGQQMTVNNCATACNTAGFGYSGVEYAQECYCGATLSGMNTNASATDCNMPCKGNASEFCGAGNRLNLYGLTANLPKSSSSSSIISSTSSSSSIVASSAAASSSSSSSAAAAAAPSVTPTSAAGSSVVLTSSSTDAAVVAAAAPSTTSSTASPVISTTSSSSAAASPVSNVAVAQWYSIGCYSDNGARAFGNGIGVPGGAANMTNANCLAAGRAAGWTLCGTEYSQECWCANSTSGTNGPASDGTVGCNMACKGNATETCGGGNRLTAFQWGIPPGFVAASVSSSSSASSAAATPVAGAPTVVASSSSASASPTLGAVQSVGNYVRIGCYSEATNGRALNMGGFTDYQKMTVELCAAYCTPKYTMFGLEYHGECYCGNSLQAGSVIKPDTDCNSPCDGNKYEYCGQGNRLDTYQLNATAATSTSSSTVSPTPTPVVAGNAANNGGAAAAASTTSSSTTSSAMPGIPTSWRYAGCWLDNQGHGRVLPVQNPDNQQLTNTACIKTCAANNYSIAATEYGVQCFCGNAFYNGAAQTVESDCGTACPGDSTQKCGAGSRLTTYTTQTGNITNYPIASSQTTVTTTSGGGNWTYAGCYSDNVNGKSLLWQIELYHNNSAQNCLGLCQQYGYMTGGMEYGEECYCGDMSKLIAAGSTKQAETDCDDPCTGDPTQLCGGGNRLSLYTWSGAPLYTWNYPTGNSAGQYQLLIGGVIVPLITTLGTNNKVTFLEKHGTGANNDTGGAWELDVSQIPNCTPGPNGYCTQAWRNMPGLQTDVFCSAGLTLPDKVGRQINIGGWSGTSTFGIRIYWPDGSPGQPSKNLWQENANEVALTAGRWYPSAMIMANGSILVVGGESGSNADPTPSLEILPATGAGSIYMDWLDRTDPLNLYPFLFVLPSGNILVCYYNEARILDENTFATVRTLPNMPGSVNNFLAGRTYPLEGTAVMLPQVAPYTAPVTVMVCGGSSTGAGQAIDNCVSIQPELTNQNWTIERMPSQRVMTCMTALPDGTFLILNGATAGVAGFGLGRNPNEGAVLYDPSKPVNQRMSIMANTIVARMYHSEAILLPDGRVMVSGSDPEEPAGGNPQEYRVEQFLPPYLLNGRTQPSYTIAKSNADWAYGGSYPITVTMPMGDTVSRISLMGAVSSTHGTPMGQRTLFPAFSCSGSTCTITAPPNAHVCPPGWYMVYILDSAGTPSTNSQWVRIGGDPANFGAWPNFPDFTLPGSG